MTDITVTVEDGLRLSELQGQLAQLQYDMAHVSEMTMGSKIGACLLALLFAFLVFLIATQIVDRLNHCPDRVYLTMSNVQFFVVLAVSFIFFAVVCHLACGYIEHLKVIDIESQMTNIQGQMDAIYAKYGGA